MQTAFRQLVTEFEHIAELLLSTEPTNRELGCALIKNYSKKQLRDSLPFWVMTEIAALYHKKEHLLIKTIIDSIATPRIALYYKQAYLPAYIYASGIYGSIEYMPYNYGYFEAYMLDYTDDFYENIPEAAKFLSDFIPFLEWKGKHIPEFYYYTGLIYAEVFGRNDIAKPIFSEGLFMEGQRYSNVLIDVIKWLYKNYIQSGAEIKLLERCIIVLEALASKDIILQELRALKGFLR